MTSSIEQLLWKGPPGIVCYQKNYMYHNDDPYFFLLLGKYKYHVSVIKLQGYKMFTIL